MITISPQLASLVALVVLSLAPSNYALSPPTTSALSSLVGDRSPSTVVLHSQSSAAPDAEGEGTRLVDIADARKSSFLRRIFKTKTSSGGVMVRTDNNSTVPAPADAARRVGVKPTLEASRKTWRRAWRVHWLAMGVLHRFDECRPKDSKLALSCLWWKALGGNDPTSPVHDDGLSYDLLPPVTRRVVHRRLRRLYPRLHHANVEIRTAYLDRAVSDIINAIMSDDVPNGDTTATNARKRIRLIVMGGGYDTRSMKLLESSLWNDDENGMRQQSRRQRWNVRWGRNKRRVPLNAFQNITSNEYDLECYELDLPEVVQAKQKLFETRLFRRRPWLREMGICPNLLSVDFNNLEATRNALEGILLLSNGGCEDAVGASNIILFEGVMIYLDEGVPHALLGLCGDLLRKSNSASGHLCFADRLENIPGGDEDAAEREMEGAGWELADWLPKPGLARHMGVARLKD